MAEEANRKATELYLASDFEGAWKGYSKAMKLEPKVAKYAMNRAQAAIRSNRPDLAITDASLAVALAPKEPKAFAKRATAYELKKLFDMAIKDWTQACKLSPDNAIYAASKKECHLNIVNAELNVNAAAEQESMTLSFENKKRVQEMGLDMDQLLALSKEGLPKMSGGFDLVILAHLARDSSNFKEAFSLYLEAGNEGNAEGLYNAAILAPLYFPSRINEAFGWLSKASEMSPYLIGNLERIGVREALDSMGICYRDGSFGQDVNPKKAFEYFQRSAALNYPGGMNNLGFSYANGFGTAVNAVTALEWYERARERGFPTSQFNAAIIYLQGAPGVPVNLAKGKKLLQMAVDQQLPSALHYAAQFNFSGNALEALIAAAETDDPLSMYNLAVCYQTGTEGAAKNLGEARRWYTKAAKLGYSPAAFNLALLFLKGDDHTEKNLSKAFKYAERAAQSNHGKGAYLLHNLYLFGDGVPKPDFVKAQLWLDVAVKQGVVADAKIQFPSQTSR